ncbi:hypothetical protein EYF80_059658 [Liparis tanakae]|uniref:Uncharacterized protein n=1 Tax=Liparis tanakae TaxID=230148 RepID=A0A4Z2ENM1_9TELE|nr:hypothetical protein EYF80_059658 [Liparis tanakae]
MDVSSSGKRGLCTSVSLQSGKLFTEQPDRAHQRSAGREPAVGPRYGHDGLHIGTEESERLDLDEQAEPPQTVREDGDESTSRSSEGPHEAVFSVLRA